MKENKNSRQIRIVLPLIVEPVVSFSLGLWVSSRLNLTGGESLILSSVMTLLVALLDLNVSHQLTMKKLISNNKEMKEKLDELKILSELQDKMASVRHPYFQKWAAQRLRAFISENEAFFEGENQTNPHAEDTFGIEGIQYTKEYGSLKAVSSVRDYWEDDFTHEYLRVQGELIKEKHVVIQRIFIFPRKKWDEMKKVMKRQNELGIKTFYCFSENEYMNPQWKDEDFLIQDDQLLVQIDCKSHRFDQSDGKVERITLDPGSVKDKRELFARMLERAKPFADIK